MRTIILASLLLAVTSAPSFAATPLINARQNVQQHRIFKGVQQGDLSFNETLKLERGQQRVQNMKNQRKRAAVSLHRSNAPASTPRKTERAHLPEAA